MAERFLAAFAPTNMNDNILYHSLVTRSTLRAFGLTPPLRAPQPDGRNAGGRSGTLAPAASLVLLRGRERMERTDWEEA